MRTTSIVAVMEDGPRKTQASLAKTYLATTSAFLHIAVMGMLTAYSAPATVDMKKPGSRFRFVTPDQITWIASLPNFSGALGNFVSGYVSHRLGRKSVLMYISTAYVASWLMVAYAPNLACIYAGRIICGFCSGVCTVAAPAYVVEIAPARIRGFLSSGFQVAFTLGVFMVMSLGIGLRWSWLAMAGAILATITACLMLFMPESPVWLIRMSRSSEALRGLKFLRGDDSDFKKELQTLTNDISNCPDGDVTWREFLEPTLYKPVIITVSLMFFQQFSGINPLMSYTVDLFQKAGSSVDPAVAATIVAAVQVIGTLLSSMLMDRSGRRRLFMISGFFMALALVVLGLYSYFQYEYTSNLKYYGWIPLMSFVVYIFSYSLGVGPIPFVMTPELATVRTRSTVLAIAAFCCSVFAFVVTKIYEDMRSVMGDYGVFWTYGFFSLSGVIFCYIFIPETKGMTIQQIHRSFSVPMDPSP